jgi:hypothetical protein
MITCGDLHFVIDSLRRRSVIAISVAQQRDTGAKRLDGDHVGGHQRNASGFSASTTTAWHAGALISIACKLYYENVLVRAATYQWWGRRLSFGRPGVP